MPAIARSVAAAHAALSQRQYMCAQGTTPNATALPITTQNASPLLRPARARSPM